jgi:hypothetical protein
MISRMLSPIKQKIQKMPKGMKNNIPRIILKTNFGMPAGLFGAISICAFPVAPDPASLASSPTPSELCRTLASKLFLIPPLGTGAAGPVGATESGVIFVVTFLSPFSRSAISAKASIASSTLLAGSSNKANAMNHPIDVNKYCRCTQMRLT